MQVLLKFLQVFSKFDWDTFCLSLQGLIPLNSFPDFKGKGCLLHCVLCVVHPVLLAILPAVQAVVSCS